MAKALYDRERTPRQPAKETTEHPRWVIVLGRVSMGIVAGVVVVVAPVISVGAVAGVAAGAAVLVGAARPEHRTQFHRARLSPTLALFVVVVAIATTAFVVNVISPTPLPTVALQLADGRVTSGPLVTFADGTWYFGGRRNRLHAIAAEQVRSATITPVHRRHDPVDETLIYMIFG